MGEDRSWQEEQNMRRRTNQWWWIVALAMVVAGCSQQNDPVEPIVANRALAKGGTETLGDPGVDLAPGAGMVVAGAGMVVQPATIDLEVPGAAVEQVIVYWSGGTDGEDALGDATLELNGNEITGELIGGPTLFTSNYSFTSYRADITALGLVNPGVNSITASGLSYEFSGANENNGVGVLVIYSAPDRQAELQLRDGLDLAFFLAPEPLDATTPQTFLFEPTADARTADLLLFCGSVGSGRLTEIIVTIEGVGQTYRNVLGSNDGSLWDSVTLPVSIPPQTTSLTVEVVSVPVMDMSGASLSWVATGFTLPVPVGEPDQPGDPVACTYGMGFWKNHTGSGPQPDLVSPLLPIWLGDPAGERSLAVVDAAMAEAVLKMHTYGHPANGVTKLYAFMLTAKLNIAQGASDLAVATALSEADAFLAVHDWQEWHEFDRDQKQQIRSWRQTFADFNAGLIGPGACDEGEVDTK
jgi:hypothetical protein